MNQIKLIKNNKTLEIEMVTVRQVLEAIRSIDGKEYNKETNRWTVPIAKEEELVRKIKCYCAIESINEKIEEVEVYSDVYEGRPSVKLSKYDKTIVDLIKLQKGAYYHRDTKVWTFSSDISESFLVELQKIKHAKLF